MAPACRWYEPLVERDLVPDRSARAASGAFQRTAARRRPGRPGTPAGPSACAEIEQLKAHPIAIEHARRQCQHYEVPAEFFAAVWEASQIQLLLLADRRHAGYRRAPHARSDRRTRANRRRPFHPRSGLRLGRFLALRRRALPRSSVTGVSNSHSQRQYIEDQARRTRTAPTCTSSPPISTTSMPGSVLTASSRSK